jgi:beta-N-acetylhexosaminidase
MKRLGRCTVVVMLAVAAVASARPSGGASAPSAAGASPQPTLAQLVGQHLLVRMRGTSPSRSFLRRVTLGQVGGVVLFGDNVSLNGVGLLVARLQAAARAGGQLPLLIAIDQEGGAVKRLAGPPTLAPAAMRPSSTAYLQGLATARSLKLSRIGVDLAPVLDVPTSSRSFIYPRAFSSDPADVSARGVAFARGLVRGGVAATAKHFPGLGRLATSTDFHPGRVDAGGGALARDLAPFRAAVRAGVPAVMVGTAVYPAYDATAPAACSRAIVTSLLRRSLGFRGVTFSDDLDTGGVRPFFAPSTAAVRAVQAGIDMVYVAGVGGSGGAAVGERAYAAILRAARTGAIGGAQLRASYARIARLKQRYASF